MQKFISYYRGYFFVDNEYGDFMSGPYVSMDEAVHDNPDALINVFLYNGPSWITADHYWYLRNGGFNEEATKWESSKNF